MSAKDELLLKACETSDLELANQALKKSMLTKGASVTAWIDGDWRTPLHVATKNGFKGIVALLLENGADVNATTKSGETPLSLAIEKGDAGIVKVLLDYGADVRVRVEFDNTPLPHAVDLFMEENPEIVRLLVDKGADIHIEDVYGTSPLVVASERGEDEIVDILGKQGAPDFSCAYAQMGGDFDTNVILVESMGSSRGRVLDTGVYMDSGEASE